jgi:hypothetical protein
MNESFEVVLQGVAKDDLFVLLNSLVSCANNMANITFSEGIVSTNVNDFNREVVEEILQSKGNLCVSANLYMFNVARTIVVPFILLRVIKYDGKIDVELCFDDTRIASIHEVMFAMQGYVKQVAEKVNIEIFYGGMEPAVDIDTRYFTNDSWGPLMASQ